MTVLLPLLPGCLSRNFGQREVLRIQGQEGVWACILCNPKVSQSVRHHPLPLPQHAAAGHHVLGHSAAN